MGNTWPDTSSFKTDVRKQPKAVPPGFCSFFCSFLTLSLEFNAIATCFFVIL